jgi:4-azaleucine resistance transporter AzlC
MNKRTVRAALAVSLPVILGYLSIGLVFGLMLSGIGYPWWLAGIMSLTVYAGTGQYLAVEFFARNTPLLEIAAMTFILNSRHMFYGLSLFDQFNQTGKFKPYMIFSLTDETYALLTSISPPADVEPGNFYVCLSAINHAAWIAGSLLGAVIGALIPINTTGIDFALTALFIVLLLEQMRTFKTRYPFLIGLASGLAALCAVGAQAMLLPAVVAATALLFLLRTRIEADER